MWLLVKNICGKRESSCKVVSAANSDSSAVSLPSYSVPITVLQAARHERISFSVWFSSHAQVTWTEVGHQIFSQRFSFILTFLSSLGYLLVPSGGVDVHHVCWGFMAVAHLDGLNSRGLWWSCVPRHIKSQIKQICMYIYIFNSWRTPWGLSSWLSLTNRSCGSLLQACQWLLMTLRSPGISGDLSGQVTQGLLPLSETFQEELYSFAFLTQAYKPFFHQLSTDWIYFYLPHWRFVTCC